MRHATVNGWLPYLMIACLSLTSSGCVNLAANLIYAIRGDKVEPEYSGLKGKKVAVVVGGEKGIGNDASCTLMARYMEMLLKQNVKDITIIPQEKVGKWLSERGMDEPDYEAIGKGIGAERIVAINLTNVSLRDGKTLYKGRADISVSVFDITQGGSVAFRRDMVDYEYPKLDGPSIVDTTEAKFRVLFLTIVSKQIGALFYPHDPKELAVLDPIALSN